MKYSGGGNFIGSIGWESKTKSQNTTTAYNKLQPKIEYILVYSKDPKVRFNLRKIGEREYPLSDENGIYRIWQVESMNASGVRGRESMVYPMLGVYPPSGQQWKIGKDKAEEYNTRGDLYVENGRPHVKIRPTDERDSVTEPFWGFFDKSIGTAESAKSHLKTIISDSGFDTVKPIEMIKRLVVHASNPNSIILDFFAGSSTTAHAVMQLNAEDGGNRQFIMVQIPQETQPKDEAYKAGYKTIAEISKERIRRAGAKIKADHAEKEGIEKLDTGFRVLKVDSKSMKDFYYKPHEYTQQHLFGMVDTLKPDRTSEDLLFEFMLSNGIPLSYSVGQIEVGGHTIYLVEDGAELVAYLDYVDTTMIQPIDDYRPAKVLIAERAIKSDSDKTNIIEQFKKIKSDIRVIFI